jgi:YidC/Oxa1 family membrane protein insertase
MAQPAAVLTSFGTDRTAMLLVGVPLMLLAAVATHFTARLSMARQPANPALGGGGAPSQAAVISRLSVWVFPLFAIVGGPFLPIAILIYWLANNCWTLVQQRIVYRRIDRDEASRATAPAVVESVETAGAASASVAEAVLTEQPGEIPGVLEDRSHDVDKPGGAR